MATILERAQQLFWQQLQHWACNFSPAPLIVTPTGYYSCKYILVIVKHLFTGLGAHPLNSHILFYKYKEACPVQSFCPFLYQVATFISSNLGSRVKIAQQQQARLCAIHTLRWNQQLPYSTFPSLNIASKCSKGSLNSGKSKAVWWKQETHVSLGFLHTQMTLHPASNNAGGSIERGMWVLMMRGDGNFEKTNLSFCLNL